jgi:hypothetical protein
MMSTSSESDKRGFLALRGLEDPEVDASGDYFVEGKGIRRILIVTYKEAYLATLLLLNIRFVFVIRESNDIAADGASRRVAETLRTARGRSCRIAVISRRRALCSLDIAILHVMVRGPCHWKFGFINKASTSLTSYAIREPIPLDSSMS